MRLLRDKRGVELSMNVIIIAIILVIVLVVVVLFFTGGASNAIQNIRNILFTQTIDSSTAKLKCDNFCNQYTQSNEQNSIWKKNFCAQNMNIDTKGTGKADLVNVNCLDIQESCPAITSCGA